MIKRDEIANPASCLSRAGDDELIFVLLARDVSAAVAVRAWCADRIKRGKNLPSDRQITEAYMWAESVEQQHA